MRRGVFLAILFAALATRAGAATGDSAPVIVETNDRPVHISPDSETFRFHNGLLVVTLRYKYEPPFKLAAVDVTCNGRRQSFDLPDLYYAYWNTPAGQVEVDRHGRFVLARFGLALSTEAKAKVGEHYLIINCDRRSTDLGVQE